MLLVDSPDGPFYRSTDYVECDEPEHLRPYRSYPDEVDIFEGSFTLACMATDTYPLSAHISDLVPASLLQHLEEATLILDSKTELFNKSYPDAVAGMTECDHPCGWEYPPYALSAPPLLHTVICSMTRRAENLWWECRRVFNSNRLDIDRVAEVRHIIHQAEMMAIVISQLQRVCRRIHFHLRPWNWRSVWWRQSAP